MDLSAKALIDLINELNDRRKYAEPFIDNLIIHLISGEFKSLVSLARIGPPDSDWNTITDPSKALNIKGEKAYKYEKAFKKAKKEVQQQKPWPQGEYLCNQLINQYFRAIRELFENAYEIEEESENLQNDELHRLESFSELVNGHIKRKLNSEIIYGKHNASVFPETNSEGELVIRTKGIYKPNSEEKLERNIQIPLEQKSPIEYFERALENGVNLDIALEGYLNLLHEKNGILPQPVRNRNQQKLLRDRELYTINNAFNRIGKSDLIDRGNLKFVYDSLCQKEKEEVNDYDQLLPLSVWWSRFLRLDNCSSENKDNYLHAYKNLIENKIPRFTKMEASQFKSNLSDLEIHEIYEILQQIPCNAFITIFNKEKILFLHKEGGPLANWLVGVKDVFCLERTTAGSSILQSFESAFISTVVEKLQQAGCLLVGKLNCDEFALGSSNETTAFKPAPGNPVNRLRVPGGSSGGSAAAVKAGLVRIALGSDTAGSIRVPAAYCGVVGWKPSYGAVSRFGLLPLSNSLDVVGLLARNVNDCVKVASIIIGEDPKDETTRGVLPQHFEKAVKELKNRTWRIGVPIEYFLNVNKHYVPLYSDLIGTRKFEELKQYEESVHKNSVDIKLDDEIKKRNIFELDKFKNTIPQYWDLFKNILKKIETIGWQWELISLPHTWLSIPAYFSIARAELASNLHRFDGITFGERKWDSPINKIQEETRYYNLGVQPKLRILMGISALRQEGILKMRIEESVSEKEEKKGLKNFLSLAKRARTLIKEDFDRVFSYIDAILGPTVNLAAPPYGGITDSVAQQKLDELTVPANHAGVPAITLPWGEIEDHDDIIQINGKINIQKLPAAVQVITPRFEDTRLLAIAQKLEDLRNESV